MMKSLRGQSRVLIGSKDVSVEWYISKCRILWSERTLMPKFLTIIVRNVDIGFGCLDGVVTNIVVADWRNILGLGAMDWNHCHGWYLSPIMALSVLDIVGSYMIGDLLMSAVIARPTKLGDERGGVFGEVLSIPPMNRNMKVNWQWLAFYSAKSAIW